MNDISKKKYGKYIPPKIEFKGDISIMQEITKIHFGYQFISNLMFFKGYLILVVDRGLEIYDIKNFEKIFSQSFADDDIISLKEINEDTLILTAFDKIRIIKFEEKEKKITHEIIQEISDTTFYYIETILSNDLLLLAGHDKKYAFYQVENYKIDKKISKNNLYRKIGEISDVHNVYNDDFASVIDLNNGYLLSKMNDDENFKIIQYEGDFKIIKSFDGYGLHDACLISDKYVVLKGLNYPEYFTWLLDMEKLEVVEKWQTPENDSFLKSLGENKFFTGNDNYFTISEIKEDNGKLKMEEISRSDNKGFETLAFFQILNERTFIACAYDYYDSFRDFDYKTRNYLVVYQCLCEYENI